MSQLSVTYGTEPYKERYAALYRFTISTIDIRIRLVLVLKKSSPIGLPAPVKERHCVAVTVAKARHNGVTWDA